MSDRRARRSILIPAAVVTALTPAAAQATTTEPTSDTASTSDTATSAGDQQFAAPPDDIELQVDILLGLVPQDVANEYEAAQIVQEHERIQDCMAEAGFVYHVVESRALAIQVADGTDPEWAAQWGFGLWTTLSTDAQVSAYGGANTDDEADEANSHVDDLAGAEQSAWYAASSRCAEQAFGRRSDDYLRHPAISQALADFEAETQNDPRVREADAT